MDLNLKKITKAELLDLYYKTSEQNERLKSELEDKTKGLDASSAVIVKTNNILAQKKKDYDNLSQKLEEVNSELSEANALIEQKNAQYTIVSQTLSNAESEMSKANESINALQEAIDELTSELQALKFKYKRMNLIWAVISACLSAPLVYLIFRVSLG